MNVLHYLDDFVFVGDRLCKYLTQTFSWLMNKIVVLLSEDGRPCNYQHLGNGL